MPTTCTPLSYNFYFFYPQTYRCTCYGGWIGVDCSLRDCPTGIPWTSYPTADDVARSSEVECSNMVKYL